MIRRPPISTRTATLFPSPTLFRSRTITELVTAAVVNASLFASQQEAVARLRELDVLKTVFLSTASHELRTPATAIGGFATLLTASWDRFDDERRREFADRIAANARSLDRKSTRLNSSH